MTPYAMCHDSVLCHSSIALARLETRAGRRPPSSDPTCPLHIRVDDGRVRSHSASSDAHHTTVAGGSVVDR
eukprot:scaffold6769_cov114-Isochrysis_galbana.AAC.1